jgi:nitrate/TMAO reductase-like tetraheme cytochrome c subunit
MVSIRTLGLGLGLVVAIGVVGLGGAIEVTSQPNFCGSCHIMEPYWESWKNSSHRNIACVECHISPGVTAELRKKYEALSMVVKYFTGTYSTNPWAEVDDAACLRCHERRLLQGKELFGDVLFDHTAHLTSSRRGTVLRCTSCHGQMVQGNHIAVTGSTCVLCHFKGKPSGSGTARCTLCHQVPERVIQRGTLTFSHADVGRYGMDCTWCHARPAGSDGAVPRERCITCHNEPKRLAEYENPELLHRTHVTEHKVDCLNCHLLLPHVGEPKLEQAVESCDSCHKAGHSPQLSLYTGLGGRGVEPMPSPMFSAGVRCEGCHIALPGHSNDVYRASEVSCMSCHGPKYGGVLARWKQTLQARTAGLERQIVATETALPGAGARPQPLLDARFNLDLVTRGHGVHNVDYAYALLDRAHRDLNQAREAHHLLSLAAPWPVLPESSCLRCHQGIETQRGTIFGRSFAHEPHLVQAKLGCESCHRPHEERAKDEVVHLDAAGCDSCHHKQPRPDCLTCHAGVKSRKVKSFRGEFDHAFHLDEAETGCDDCHAVAKGLPVTLLRDACATCHKG